MTKHCFHIYIKSYSKKKGKEVNKRFSFKEGHPDPEIQPAIDKGVVVRILYDSH